MYDLMISDFLLLIIHCLYFYYSLFILIFYFLISFRSQ